MFKYITYLQIFASFFFAFFSLFFPGIITYKQFVVVLGGISLIAILYEFIVDFRNQTVFLLVVILLAILVFSYYTTGQRYGYYSEKYPSFFLVLLGNLTPVVLCAVIVSKHTFIQQQVIRLAPIVSLIFTVLAFVSTFFHTSSTSGGYIDNEFGLNYQTVSYAAAYGGALAGFFVNCHKTIHWPLFFNADIWKVIMLSTIYVDFVIILFAGGRGGLIMFLMQIVLFFYILSRRRVSRKQRLAVVLIFLLTIVFVPLAINYVQSSGFDGVGFERIVQFIRENDQSGRQGLRAKAYESFLESPIIGHGIGSVFYEVGHYSHNSVLDVLVETGLVGLIFYSGLLGFVIFRLVKMMKEGIASSLWTILFLGSFMMSLSSGYYLAQLPMWWTVVFVILKRTNR